MKVYVIISANALPGKWHEAPKAAVESVQYLNANSNYVGKYEIVAGLALSDFSRERMKATASAQLASCVPPSMG